MGARAPVVAATCATPPHPPGAQAAGGGAQGGARQWAQRGAEPQPQPPLASDRQWPSPAPTRMRKWCAQCAMRTVRPPTQATLQQGGGNRRPPPPPPRAEPKAISGKASATAGTSRRAAADQTQRDGAAHRTETCSAERPEFQVPPLSLSHTRFPPSLAHDGHDTGTLTAALLLLLLLLLLLRSVWEGARASAPTRRPSNNLVYVSASYTLTLSLFAQSLSPQTLQHTHARAACGPARPAPRPPRPVAHTHTRTPCHSTDAPRGRASNPAAHTHKKPAHLPSLTRSTTHPTCLAAGPASAAHAPTHKPRSRRPLSRAPVASLS